MLFEVKRVRFFLSLAFLCLFLGTVGSVFGVELPESNVYRNLSSHRIVKEGQIRLFYPKTIQEAMPNMLKGFVEIRNRLVKLFPSQANRRLDVILVNYDDCIQFNASTNLDILQLEIFEEIGMLSSRSYSLNRRFAIKLSRIMLLSELASSGNILGRKLGELAVPVWFIEGLTLNYAFPLESMQMSRLIDMTKYGRLYNLRQLASMDSQPETIKEEMQFQTHSMIDFWNSKYKSDAAINLLKSLYKRPGSFLKCFKEAYGVDLYVAYNAYEKYMRDFSSELVKEKTDFSEKLIDSGQYFRSYRNIGSDRHVWVSSKRYSTESYDLYIKRKNKRACLLAKNVHPLYYYDEPTGNIIYCKYALNSLNQRRLSLWKLNPDTGSRSCLVKEPGSFMPLGRNNENRIMFVSLRNGSTRIMSVDMNVKHSEQVEFIFPSNIRPVDLCMNGTCTKLYYVYETPDFKSQLAVINADVNGIFSGQGEVINGQESHICSICCDEEDTLWFAAEDKHFAQLCSLKANSDKISHYVSLPGGVWDIDINKKGIRILTLDNGRFKIVYLPCSIKPVKTTVVLKKSAPLLDTPEYESHPYDSVYSKGAWIPVISKDDEGYVLGIMTYQRDMLGRSEIVVTPTYGLKSNDTGYMFKYKQRMGMLNLSLEANQTVKKKKYLSNDFYEGNVQQVLQLEYALNMSTLLKGGLDMNERSIEKIEYDGSRYPVPSTGQDNSLFFKVEHIAIHTEPFWQVLPRRGRRVNLEYRYGSDFFNGDMDYNSVSLKWSEYCPLSSDLVLTLKTYIGEDSKHGNLRRPQDLELGGDAPGSFLKSFPDAFKNGDRLRAFSVHLGMPIDFRYPRFMSWLYNDFSAAEFYMEMGDVTPSGSFDWHYDRGVELKSQVRLFKRLPVTLTVGYAQQNGGRYDNTYVNFGIDDLSGLVL